MTDLTTQAARDAAPTVAPVEGCYALRRDGNMSRATKAPIHDHLTMVLGIAYANGKRGAIVGVDTPHFQDIIATYTPAQLLAPRPDHTCPVQVERVRHAIFTAESLSGSSFVMSEDRAIAALKAMEAP